MNFLLDVAVRVWYIASDRKLIPQSLLRKQQPPRDLVVIFNISIFHVECDDCIDNCYDRKHLRTENVALCSKFIVDSVSFFHFILYCSPSISDPLYFPTFDLKVAWKQCSFVSSWHNIIFCVRCLQTHTQRDCIGFIDLVSIRAAAPADSIQL